MLKKILINAVSCQNMTYNVQGFLLPQSGTSCADPR